MEFVLTFEQPTHVYMQYADPAKGPALMQAWKTYMDEMAAKGIMRGGNRMHAMGSSTVRVRNGQPSVEENAQGAGELLGGYVVIDVPSMDEALHWASKSPSSLSGSTQVHPVLAV